MSSLSPELQAFVDDLREHLRQNITPAAPRRRDWRRDDYELYDPAPDPWLCPEPRSEAIEAEGLHQDTEAERIDCHEFDPDDDRPHPGGSRWEQAINGEAWRP